LLSTHRSAASGRCRLTVGIRKHGLSLGLAGSLPSPALEAYPVGRAFRDLKRDDYTPLEPVDPDLETTSPPPVDGDGDGWDEDG
jgi:hypothetical protein